MRFCLRQTLQNEKLLWEIESLLREEDSKKRSALILQKIFSLSPQQSLTDSTEGVIFLIEEKNRYWGEKIRGQLTKTPSKKCSIDGLSFSLLVIFLLQAITLVRVHQLLSVDCRVINCTVLKPDIKNYGH